MRFGLSAFCTATTLDPATLARLAESVGFDVLLFADHTHLPLSSASAHPSGGPTPEHYADVLDPFSACAFAMAATSSLRIGTGVCLVPARDPIILAKQCATLDVLSSGRFIFGVGAGWNAAEMADHGVDPAQRWEVMMQRLRAIIAIWSSDVAECIEPLSSFGPMRCGPAPIQRPHPPIVIGGHGPGVLRRVVELGDEWLAMPSRGAPPLADRVAELARLADAVGRPRPSVSVQVYGDRPPVDVIERCAAAGVDRIDLGLPHGTVEQGTTAIERFAEVIARHR